MGVESAAAGSLKKTAIRILEWTEGKRVKLLAIGDTLWTGEEVRHKLGLRSASFDWAVSRGEIVLTTYGSGHGVGMSQWGAEGMAKAGKSADQIIAHYYRGSRVEKASNLLKRTKSEL
jgi:stage II sporulation protein D